MSTLTALRPTRTTSRRWARSNLTSLAAAPPSLWPRPYVRSDGISSVVSYSRADDRIRELTFEPGGWKHYDLQSFASGSPVEGHTPVPYVRSDGVSAVVYLSRSGRIHELTLVSGGWHHHNLSDLTGAPVSLDWALGAYIRGDGLSAVVYRGLGHHVHELALAGGTWIHTDLTVHTGGPTPGPFDGELRAFARSDGASAVVYTGGDGRVRQFAMAANGGWASQNLTGDGGEPRAALQGLAGYVRTDRVNAIVYRGEDKHLYELTQGSRGEFDVLKDLTAITGAAPAVGHVDAYNRADGTSTVIYEGPDFHIHELAHGGGSSWSHADLTALTGGRPGLQPHGYVRSDGATAIVYYDLDNHVRQLKLN